MLTTVISELILDIISEVAEWPIAADLKSANPKRVHGFESHPLR